MVKVRGSLLGPRGALFIAGALGLGALSAMESGCASREIAVDVDFEPDATGDLARAVEVHVVASCSGVSLDRSPDAPLQTVAFRRGSTAMALGGSLPERFGVVALARDASCRVMAGGCAEVLRTDALVRVIVRPRAGSDCGSRGCADGLCSGSAAIDAGMPPDAHEPIDAFMPVDAPRDAPPDAGVVPEGSCDCVDDDVDGAVDEGCAAQGAGTVLFQRVLDGPGTDALRGAALGGDGRIYVNGWLSEDADFGCGNLDRVPMGGSASGPSHLLALDPTDGRCLATFERPRDLASPFGSPWTATGGVWLYTVDGLRRYDTMVADLVTMTPPADFAAGAIAPSPADPSDLLLVYTTPVGSVSLGGQTNDNTLGSMVGRVTWSGGAAPYETRWLRSVTGPAVAARPDATSWALALPNASDGSNCRMVTGPSRVEFRDVEDPTACLAAASLPMEIRRGDELAGVGAGGRAWFVSRQEDGRVILAAVSMTGPAIVRELPAADPGSPLLHLAAMPDGSVLLGASARPGSLIDGAPAGSGYIVRASVSGDAISLRGLRRLGQHTLGISVRGDGVAFVNSSGFMGDPLCTPTPSTLTTDPGGSRLITAIQL